MHHRFDLVVLGAGSGGYAAARVARDLGASVAFVDRGPLGGLCILRGCMPSKTLIATGDAMHEVSRIRRLGVEAGPAKLHWDEVIARKRETIQGFADYRIAGIETFPTFMGEGRFTGPHTLAVGDDVLEAKRVVIATGSVIAPAALPGLAEAGYIDSDDALDLETPPRSLIVLGGGYVGTELGQFFYRTGIPVTFVIRAGHLLSGEDRDIGEGLTEALRAEGIGIETRAQLHRVSVRPDGMKVVHFTRDGAEHEVAAHEIMYALGRVPAVAGLDLERAGITYHAIGGIEVDASLRTSNPDVFAVGDVNGLFQLVHVAIQQGEVAGRNAVTGGDERADYRVSKAHTVFSDPQVAIAGDTEKELVAAGVAYLKATYPFDDHGKAISIGKTAGFVKMLGSPVDGRILGIQILGADASDLIHTGIVALHYHATVQDYARIPHLHPTMAEILTYPAEEIAEQIATGAPLAFAG